MSKDSLQIVLLKMDGRHLLSEKGFRAIFQVNGIRHHVHCVRYLMSIIRISLLPRGHQVHFVLQHIHMVFMSQLGQPKILEERVRKKLKICEHGHSHSLKVVLEGYHRCPDSHDLRECHHLYDLGRHI